MKLTALALLLGSGAALVAAGKDVKRFDDVKDHVRHVTHRPRARALGGGGLGRDVATYDLSVRLTVPVGDGRTATVDARPTANLLPEGYTETIMYGNGTTVEQSFPHAQRRCHWSGPVTFSDGTDGHMAFTSCHRGSKPHADYLMEADKDESGAAPDSPLHYVSGVILDYATGKTLTVEPADFQNYKKGHRSSARQLRGKHGSNGSSDDDDDDLSGDVELGDHVTYDSADVVKASGRDHECGNAKDPDHHLQEFSHHHDHDHDQVARRLLQSDFAREQRRRASDAPIRYVELQVTNDAARVDTLGAWRTADETISVVNAVNVMYGSRGVASGLIYDVRVTLMGQVLMSGSNPWDGSVRMRRGSPSSGPLLDEFGRWAYSEGSYNTNNPDYDFDNAHLFSGEDFKGDTIGLAWMGTMCLDNRYNAGISEVIDVDFAATTVAHEMGHNFDMDHDGDGNNCNPAQYVMAAYALEETDLHFSDCSAANFNDNVDNLDCLTDVEPVVDWTTGTSTTTQQTELYALVRPQDASLTDDWDTSTGTKFTVAKRKKRAQLKLTAGGPSYADYTIESTSVPDGVSTFDVAAVVSAKSLEGDETCALAVSTDGGETFTTEVASVAPADGSGEVEGSESVVNEGSGLVVRLVVTNDNRRDKCFLNELVVDVSYGGVAL